MKLCDFVNHVLWRAANRPEMVRIIHYKIGQNFDFYDSIEEYGFLTSEIEEHYFKSRVPDYYNLNICCTWYDEEKILHIVVEL